MAVDYSINYPGYVNIVIIVSTTLLAIAPIFFSFTRKEIKKVRLLAVSLLASFAFGIFTLIEVLRWQYYLDPNRQIIASISGIQILFTIQVILFVIGAITYWVYILYKSKDKDRDYSTKTKED